MKIYLFSLFSILFLSHTLAELSGPLKPIKRSKSDQTEERGDVTLDKRGFAVDKPSYETQIKKIFANVDLLADDADAIDEIRRIDDFDDDLSDSEGDKAVDKETDEAGQLAILQMHKWMKTLADLGQRLGSTSSEESDENPEEMLDQLSPLPAAPTVELTDEEKKIEETYQLGVAQFTKSYGNKALGYSYILKASEAGHKWAKIKLAWGSLFGNHVPHDIKLAAETFKTFSKQGHSEAHTGLGLMYASGIGVNVSQPKALIHFHFGALGGNTWAQMALGYRYWAGVTVPMNCEKALEYYRRAATKVASEVSFSGGAAIQRIRLLDEHDNSGFSSGILYSNLIEYYQLLAEKGDIQTQVGLGQLHYQGGRGVPLDVQKAMHYFLRAANAGNAEAMAFLGKIYLEGGENLPASNETALRYFRKAAELNNPVGQSGLGLMYLHGRGVPRDTSMALKYFKLAADQGWVDGQLQLGNMYFGGIGVRRDFKSANKYYSLASQSGHVLAFYHLGQMHAQGMGMLASCPTAVELFKNVAERGKWGEQLMLAYNDYKQFNTDQAFVQYAIMGQLGYEVAQSNAAFLLDRGEVELFSGPTEDYVRALTFWSRAAAQGYSSAQVKLGDYHYYGLGTAVDYETAASHYRLASDQQHNAQAMFNLGYMHEQGLGMRRDIHLAKRCYDLAAETSADAKIPVSLALLKLFLVFNMESFQDYLIGTPFSLLFAVDDEIISNWDLYLITTLTAILGFVIYCRRPRLPLQQDNNVNNNNDN